MMALIRRLLWVLGFSLCADLAAQPLNWTVEVALDDQVFPSLSYAMANLRGDQMMVGNRKVRRLPQDFAMPEALAKRPFVVHFSALAPGSRATIWVRSDGLIEPVAITADLGKSRIIPISVAYVHDTLVRNRQSRPVNIDFSVSIDGRPAGRITRTVTVRSVNDCPYFFVTHKATGRGIDLSWMFAAYVNEDHPLVDYVLKIALDTGIVRSFDGYQSRDLDQIRSQVRAVWTALSLMGIRYSSITASANRSDIAPSQHVRLIGESSRANQANCVDGSVLIASVLEKIGIETDLIKVPGHMFVRFWLDPWEGDQKQYVCLETTLLGEGFPPAGSPLGQAMAAADRAYVRAWTIANEAFNKSAARFTSDSTDFKIINVGEARRRGIIPIPYLPPKAD